MDEKKTGHQRYYSHPVQFLFVDTVLFINDQFVVKKCFQRSLKMRKKTGLGRWILARSRISDEKKTGFKVNLR
jgi:hypothetical protein